MNKKMTNNYEKPVLAIDDLISIMKKNVHLMKKDEDYTMSIIIGPDFEKTYMGESYAFFNDNSDNFIDYIKDEIRHETEAQVFGNDDDLENVFNHILGLPKSMKVYSIEYGTLNSTVTFDFSEKNPAYKLDSDLFTENSFSYVTDPILNEVEDKYQPLDMY
ncbi:MAG: hypothetical protein KAI18_01490 [Candidatus Aenigmarchaeota archaeon]|nr:hypothetical protein [Candidatus Aenigmarchaeota archaeon]